MTTETNEIEYPCLTGFYGDDDIPYELTDEAEAAAELLQGEPPDRFTFSAGQRVNWLRIGALGLRRDVPATVIRITAKRVRIKPDYGSEVTVRATNLRRAR